ncbi:hypothetical protein IFM89_003225 [Coptis chinensis]|uniref:NusB/RsmB/TIM44 domain-containing protein n=1 Tax=Coptis chinensis TaxID=261450 RepID=A0A835H2Z6_9MAGN|nr:hypothetical protein IFM89_003225 [Coptis chinensis]
MEGTSVLSFNSTKPNINFTFFNSHSPYQHTQLVDGLPKIDKSGRFCSPRAARELALSIAYASCLEGSDPVRLFEKRLNARREPGYEFNKSTLLEYNHMNFAGDPVSTQTEEEAEELLRVVEMESAIEAEVLSAPPKLVYSKLILRLTKKMLVAVVQGWDKHVVVIDKVAPQNWKKWISQVALSFEICCVSCDSSSGYPCNFGGCPLTNGYRYGLFYPMLCCRYFLDARDCRANLGWLCKYGVERASAKTKADPFKGAPARIYPAIDEPAGRILEFCILHLAMTEIAILGTRHQIVINEAVDLAKRFCDGTAPRIINGCLRTFVRIHRESSVVPNIEVQQ